MNQSPQSSRSPQTARPAQVGRVPGWGFLMTSPWAFLALGFGAGLAPFWPGTFGSLLGLALAWPLRWLAPGVQIALVGAGFMLGIWACERTGEELASPDASVIVWDEVVGMAAVSLLAPAGLGWSLAGFVAFRFFDIVKPWPINLVDRQLRNGLGVMLDDALAAAYAVGTLAAASLIAAHLSL
jgi:phosphatidylglycerophosphatase A